MGFWMITLSHSEGLYHVFNMLTVPINKYIYIYYTVYCSHITHIIILYMYIHILYIYVYMYVLVYYCYILPIQWMEEILHHLGWLQPYRYWDKPPINWCRISSIHSSAAPSSPDRALGEANAEDRAPKSHGSFAALDQGDLGPRVVQGVVEVVGISAWEMVKTIGIQLI